MLGRFLGRSHASSFSVSLALALVVCACGRPPAQDPHAVYPAADRTSKKTLQIAELGIGGGLAAGAFGGAMMGVGKAIDNPQGDVTFWVGVGTLSVGIV